jgi:hypothetical protein
VIALIIKGTLIIITFIIGLAILASFMTSHLFGLFVAIATPIAQ